MIEEDLNSLPKLASAILKAPVSIEDLVAIDVLKYLILLFYIDILHLINF